MAKESLMVLQVRFVIVVRRIITLGIAITVGIVAVYAAGLIVAGNNVKEDFDVINMTSMLLLLLTVPLTYFLRRFLLGRVTMDNFESSYFVAHIIPYAMIDFSSLFCLITNLFINGNIFYASLALGVSVGGMFINYPKENFFEILKQKYTGGNIKS